METNSSVPGKTDAASRRSFLATGLTAVGVGCLGAGGVADRVSATTLGGRGQGRAGRPTRIEECTTITEPGRYRLATDLDARGEDVCIEIEADDVSLDGRSHTIDGGGSGRWGVSAGELLAVDVEDVSIRNLRVTGFTVAGIAYEDATGGRLRTVSVTDSRHGIEYGNAREVTVTNSSLTDNGLGVFATDGSGENVFARSEISRNCGGGVHVTEFSRGNVFRRNRIRDNGGSGVAFTDGSSGPIVVGNTVRNNRSHGISLSDLTDATIRSNRTFDDRLDGISLVGVDGSRVSDNVSQHNGDDGIELVDSDDNELVGNVVRNNGDEAIAIVGSSSGNTLSDNVTD